MAALLFGSRSGAIAQETVGEEDYARQALGATAEASTQIEGGRRDYLAEFAIDGETRGKYWASAFLDDTAQGPQWIEVDLGQERRIGRIALHMVAGRGVDSLLNDFTISVMVDDEWQVVADVESYKSVVLGRSFIERYTQAAGQSGVYMADFAPLVTRRVRVDVPIRTARLHEIQVLPPKPPVEPLTGSIRGAGPLLKFDFGTNESKLADGWQPVTADTTYNEQSGYGWQSADALLPVDRVIGYDVSRDFVAAAREDGGAVENTFTVDVPNGEYLVAIVSGDPSHEVRHFSVTAEDRTFSPDVVTAGSADVCRLNETVQVEDGSLDLTFAGEQAWLVSGLLVGPPDQLAAMDEMLTEIEYNFAFGSPDTVGELTQFIFEPTENPARPTAEERERGYQVFQPTTYLDHVQPNRLPAQGQCMMALEAFCTPGEAEPMTFALHAIEPLRGISVAVSDLAGPETIPAASVQIHRIQCWPQRFKSPNHEGEWGIMPELLRALDAPGEVWLGPGRNQQFWLTVTVPKDAEPGEYTGTVEVQVDNAEDIELPVSVTVYPFTLQYPRPMHWGIYYYPGDRSSPWVQDDESRRALTIADLEDLRAHGVNAFAFSLNDGMASVADRPGDTFNFDADPVEVDLSYVRWVMDCVEEVGGFEGPFPLYIRAAWQPERENRDEIIRQVVRIVEAERIEQGWPEFLYYPWDEPFFEPEISEAVEPYRALAAIDGIRTYSTLSAQAAATLAPWLDVRCHATSVETRRAAQWPEIQQNAIADGDEYWWYTNSTREYPAVMRFKAGFQHWKSRATGQTYWNYRNTLGSPFCDFDMRPGDHASAYPGVDGPIRTIQWEAHREGIDDAKYAYTLEALIERAEASDDADVRAAANDARAALEDIRDRTHIKLSYYTEHYGRRGIHWKSDWEAEQYDATRREIAEQIMALLEAGVEQ